MAEQRHLAYQLAPRRVGHVASDLEGLAKTFRQCEPDQLLLMPPAIGDWVPEGHLSRLVSELVDGRDLSIEDAYEEERGYPPYHLQLMVKVLLYAHATGSDMERPVKSSETRFVLPQGSLERRKRRSRD